MTSPRAVLRADGGPRIGGGHVSRCLAIAAALRRAGWDAALALEEAAWPLARSQAGDIACLRLASAAPEAIAAALGGEADLLLIDHYGLDAAFQAACRRFAGHIVALDDLPVRPHAADLVIDYTPERRPEDYAPLVPAGTRLLTGARYVPLKDAFARLRPLALRRRFATAAPERLLISLGAGDSRDVLGIVMDGIAQAAALPAIDIVAGGGADLAGLSQLLAGFPRHYGLHVGVRDLSRLSADADLAIGAAGVSAWERCALGLPTLLVQLADNQRDAIASLVARGAGLSLGPAATLQPADVAEALDRLAGDLELRRALSARAAEICDGLGATRIALELPPPGAATALRAARAADAELLLAWQREPATRRHARNPAVPDAAEHAAWLAETLADPARMLCVVLARGEPVGMLRLDRSADETGFEVSIVIGERHSGRGLARSALALARRLLPWAELRATVLPGNDRSHALFRAAGYRLGGDGLYRNPASLAA